MLGRKMKHKVFRRAEKISRRTWTWTKRSTSRLFPLTHRNERSRKNYIKSRVNKASASASRRRQRCHNFCEFIVCWLRAVLHDGLAVPINQVSMKILASRDISSEFRFAMRPITQSLHVLRVVPPTAQWVAPSQHPPKSKMKRLKKRFQPTASRFNFLILTFKLRQWEFN